MLPGERRGESGRGIQILDPEGGDGLVKVGVGPSALVLVEEDVLRAVKAHHPALNECLRVLLWREHLVVRHDVLEVLSAVGGEPPLHRIRRRLVEKRSHQPGVEVQGVIASVVLAREEPVRGKIGASGKLFAARGGPDRDHKELDAGVVQLRLHVSPELHRKLPTQGSPEVPPERHHSALLRLPQVGDLHLFCGSVAPVHLAPLQGNVELGLGHGIGLGLVTQKGCAP